MCRHYHIKPLKYDEFGCPYCYEIDQHEQNDLPLPPILSKHQLEKAVGLSAFTSDRQKLLPDTNGSMALMTMDYCRIHGSRDTFDEVEKSLSIFNFTLVTSDVSQYSYDLLSFAPQGAHFMEYAWDNFHTSMKARIEGVQDLYIWSDGGLQTYGTIAMILKLQALLKVTVHLKFFPPYHGHNRCDAHFGLIKRKLRSKFPVGGFELQTYSLDRKPTQEKVAEICKLVRNTEVIMPNIDPGKTKVKLTKWKWQSEGVKSFDYYKIFDMDNDQHIHGCYTQVGDKKNDWRVIHPPHQPKKFVPYALRPDPPPPPPRQ